MKKTLCHAESLFVAISPKTVYNNSILIKGENHGQKDSTTAGDYPAVFSR